jgi:hypothetical protein
MRPASVGGTATTTAPAATASQQVSRTPAALPSTSGAPRHGRRAPTARGPRSIGRTATATETATAAAPTAAPEPAPQNRPALTLVPTPAPDQPAPAPRSVARSGVDALAGSTGEVGYTEDGMATIDFTGRPGIPEIPPFNTTPVTMSRFLDNPLGGIADSARSAAGGAVDSARGAATDAIGSARGAADDAIGSARGAAGDAIGSARGAAGDAVQSAGSAAQGVLGAAAGALGPGDKPDADEMYEQVLQRLRRDLVAELEQNGLLLRDHP